MENKKLRFSADGKFRILMVSDFHCGESYNPKLKVGLTALLDATKPDFVLLGGDQCTPQDTVEGVREYMEDVLSPVLERNIPWGAVFGNHDNEMGIPCSEQQKAYDAIKGCMSYAGPEDINGTGNFNIPIYSSKEDKPAYVIWGLDSGLYQRNYPKVFGSKTDYKIVFPHRSGSDGTDGTPLFDQAMWYWNESVKYEKENGAPVPGVMFTHVPITEFYHIVNNPEECNARGNDREPPKYPEISSGLFLACLQRGDVNGIFFGHEHLTDLTGEYCGITLSCSAALGYDMSAHDDLRGGRIIELYEESGEFETYPVKLWDLMGKACMRDPEYMEGGCRYFIRKFK